MKKVLLTFSAILIITISYAQNWQELTTITSASNGSRFGYSVSLNSAGDVVAVGDYDSDFNGNDAGHTEVFGNNNETWILKGDEIIGEAASDLSGYSVSISADGNIIAVGAPWNDGKSFGGHIRIFEHVSGVWAQLGSDINGASWDISGGNVSISADGKTVALSASTCDDGDKDRVGYVKIFNFNNNRWNQKGSTLRGENEFDQFGNSISLSNNGNSLSVGAKNANDYKGYVKVFNFKNSTWVETFKKEGNFYQNFMGTSVSLNSDGSILAIGSKEKEDNSLIVGFASIYKNEDGVWKQVGGDIKSNGQNPNIANKITINSTGDVIAISENSNSSIYKNLNNVWTNVYNSETETSDVSINYAGNIVAFGSTQNKNVTILKEVNYLSNIDITHNKCKLYPNPTTGKFIINSVGVAEIINPKGQVLKTVESANNKINIDLSNQEKGFYF
ncbi:MAG: hypothetical protein KAG96_07100, partial [Ichthyobacteriaceae bacterium]|nr:hypothetical protein [Ichthyobacteriaceae bacterium]